MMCSLSVYQIATILRYFFTYMSQFYSIEYVAFVLWNVLFQVTCFHASVVDVASVCHKFPHVRSSRACCLVLVEAISREYRSLKRTPEVYSFVSKLMIRDIGLEIKHFGYKIGSSFLIY